MKDKLILFDWGNIVEAHTTGYSCYDAWNDLFKICGYSGDEEIFSQLSKYRVSRIKDIEEFEKTYRQMKEDFSFNTSFSEFVNLYRDIFEKVDYYKNVAEYEVSLKDKAKIGIFSNLTIFDKERLDKQVGLNNYDYVFLSFEFGLKKPDIEIYKKVQESVPFKPEDILFIDDRADNINTALEMGWNAFQATGLELPKIKEKCDDFLRKK